MFNPKFTKITTFRRTTKTALDTPYNNKKHYIVTSSCLSYPDTTVVWWYIDKKTITQVIDPQNTTAVYRPTVTLESNYTVIRIVGNNSWTHTGIIVLID